MSHFVLRLRLRTEPSPVELVQVGESTSLASVLRAEEAAAEALATTEALESEAEEELEAADDAADAEEEEADEEDMVRAARNA